MTMETALEICLPMLREFKRVPGESRDALLKLDLSSTQKTYYDRPLPPIGDQLVATKFTQLSILTFHAYQCHPSELLKFTLAILHRPELIPMIQAGSVYTPHDLIWKAHEVERSVRLIEHPFETHKNVEMADVNDFLHGLVLHMKELNTGDRNVDELEVMQTLYRFTVTWTPSGRRLSFVLGSWRI